MSGDYQQRSAKACLTYPEMGVWSGRRSETHCHEQSGTFANLLFPNRRQENYAEGKRYPKRAEALRKRGAPTIVLGENWLRVFAAAKAE